MADEGLINSAVHLLNVELHKYLHVLLLFFLILTCFLMISLS